MLFFKFASKTVDSLVIVSWPGVISFMKIADAALQWR